MEKTPGIILAEVAAHYATELMGIFPDSPSSLGKIFSLQNIHTARFPRVEPLYVIRVIEQKKRFLFFSYKTKEYRFYGKIADNEQKVTVCVYGKSNYILMNDISKAYAEAVGRPMQITLEFFNEASVEDLFPKKNEDDLAPTMGW